MKTLKFCFILLMISYTHSGCVSQQELQKQKNEATINALNSWKGSHKSALIQSWGPPTRYDSDGQNGEILIYENKRTIGSYLYGNYIQRTFVDYTEMFVNSAGIIYFWRKGTR